MNDCILNSFYVYLIIMILIYLIKPEFLFYYEEDKCLFKNFGCGENKSIINIQILSIVLSIFIYFITRLLLQHN